jgi:hypothetical protein
MDALQDARAESYDKPKMENQISLQIILTLGNKFCLSAQLRSQRL